MSPFYDSSKALQFDLPSSQPVVFPPIVGRSILINAGLILVHLSLVTGKGGAIRMLIPWYLASATWTYTLAA